MNVSGGARAGLRERRQVQVSLALDQEEWVAGVLVGIRALQNAEQVAALEMECDVFKGNVGGRGPSPSTGVWGMSQARNFSGEGAPIACPEGIHRHRFKCAHQCAQTGSENRPSAANGNQEMKKKRA